MPVAFFGQGQIRRTLYLFLALGSLFLAAPTTVETQAIDQLDPALAINGSSQAQTSLILQQQAARFDRLSPVDGLSHPIINQIIQDRSGFMWFATQSGLNRYDGYEFVVYKHDPDDPTTLPFNAVSTVFEDSDGVLWVGTGGGLSKLDRATGTFTHVDRRGQLNAIAEDASGILWVGFWHGLYGYDRASGEIVHTFQHDPRDPQSLSESTVRVIYEDSRSELWVGTPDGLDRLDSQRNNITHFRHDPANPKSLSHDEIMAVMEDARGGLWFGTNEGGLNRFDRETETFSHFRHDPDDPSSLGSDWVTAVLEGSDGTLWVGTIGGLDRFDPETESFVHIHHDPDDGRSLSDDAVTALYEDRSGLLWVGTGNGINKYNRRANQFPYTFQRGILTTYTDREGIIWLGTYAGLVRLDPQTGDRSEYRYDPDNPDGLMDDTVVSIFQDHAGKMWVGTGNGWLEQFDPQTETFSHHRNLGGNSINQIVEDEFHNLWMGTIFSGQADELGLYRLDRTRRSYLRFRHNHDRPDSLIHNVVTAVHVDGTGKLWVGTLGGISVLEDVNARYQTGFKHYVHDPADPASLSDNWIVAFLKMPTAEGDVIWVATEGGGLNRFDPATERFSHYTVEDGLPENTINCMAADKEGFIWLSTVKGITRFDPEVETFRNYDERDGIPSGTSSRGVCSAGRLGEMVFAGLGGLTIFDPAKIVDNLVVPPVVITTMDVFNETARRELPPDATINLSYRENYLSFEYAALDFSVPDKNQYAYILEGLDREWVTAGTRRHVDYPDLRPGNYVFRVRGSNGDGVWNEDGVAVYITIKPPFWDTWLFRGSMILVVVALAAGLYWRRVRGLELRRRELEDQVRARTTELRTANVRLAEEVAERERTEEALVRQRSEAAVLAERNRLARDLHDSVTQSLYGMGLYADTAARLLSTGQTGPAQENLEKLRQTSKDALAEMRLLIYELRPAVLDEEGLVAALQDRLSSVERRAGLGATLKITGVDRLPAEIEEGLYRIAVEALNNILKHAGADSIVVSLRRDGQHVTMSIADDGVGFDPAVVKEGGMGVPGMIERAEQMGGRMRIVSKPGSGTQVVVEKTIDEDA